MQFDLRNVKLSNTFSITFTRMDTRHDPQYRIAYLTFVGELCDFLSGRVSGDLMVAHFKGNPALKDTIESAGVPHIEIGKTEKDRNIVTLDTQLHGGEWIRVYPRKYVFQKKMSSNEQEVLLPQPPCFILDGHLGKLAVKMRMAGIDTDYKTQRTDELIVEEAVNRNCIVLTRDIGLLKHKALKYGRWIRAEQPTDQWIEVMKCFRLWLFLQPGSRCTRCNTVLDDIPFEYIAQRLPERIRESRPPVKQCAVCGHLYWRGTHFRNFMIELKNVISIARRQR